METPHGPIIYMISHDQDDFREDIYGNRPDICYISAIMVSNLGVMIYDRDLKNHENQGVDGMIM